MKILTKPFIRLLPCCVSFVVLAVEAAGLSDLDAWADPSGVVHVRWVTSTPAKGYVDYGVGTDLDTRVEEDPSCLRGTTNNRDAGTGWANNHRADFAAAEWPVSLRVKTITGTGESLVSEILRVERPALPRGTVGRASIPLTIAPGDWGEPRIPVTLGVPFPPGALADARHLRVLHDERELPSQAAVVTRWRRDFSVKWLRLSLVVPAGVESVRIEYGHEVDRGHWPDWVDDVDADAADGLAFLRDAAGENYVSRAAEPATLEESGAVKNVHRWQGRFVAADGSSLWRYILRCHTWAGVAARRWEFTVVNDRTEAEMTSIRSLVLHPLTQPTTAATVGQGAARVVLTPGSRVFQREDFEWVAQPAGTAGRRIEGVVRLADERLLVLRKFWQQYPAAITLGPDAILALELCPELPDGFYAEREDEDKFYYHLRDGLHTFRQGFSKTWEFWTGVAEPQSLLGERPVASVPPAWIEETFALRNLAVALRGQFAGYDEALKRAIDDYPGNRDRQREYGMTNFGDWYGERRWNWGNLEYDLGHGFLTQFARTGEAAFWRRAEEIIRHQRDVDTRHVADDPRRVGQQWIHSIGHTAGYYDNTYKNMKRYAGSGWSDNRGHIWSQGMFEHYLLGGDRRSWEVALLISDWAAGPQTTNFIFGNAREPGWMTKLVMGAYFATEDSFYLHAAKIMLDATHAKSLASGDHGFYHHKLPNGHCNCPDDAKHDGEAGFMLGVLMTGMKMYVDATGDATVADDISKIAQFIWDSMWVPQDLGFRYTSCPHTNASSSSTWIMMEGLAYGARRSNSPELADLCRNALMASWNHLSRNGKSAGSVLSASAQALHEVAHLPGKTFAEERERMQAVLSSPARRPLPALLANPDFEVTIAGWPSRGWEVGQCTEISHGGRASLQISGEVAGQNEYVNTVYDTSSSPYEIRSLTPGAVYVLSAWLRVDRLTPGAPAPSLRLATRDDGGTRGAVTTTPYDLTRSGTWQRLVGRAEIPQWNTRNYIALNTNTREALDVLMYLDDVRLIREEAHTPASSTHICLDPGEAVLAEGTACVPHNRFAGDQALGAGSAVWNVTSIPAGDYAVWVRMDEGATCAVLTVNGTIVCRDLHADILDWHRVGDISLKEGPLEVSVAGLSDAPLFGRIVLTTESIEGR